VKLVWDAPEGCPDARSLGAEIRRQLRDPESVRSIQPLVVRARARREPEQWRLELEIGSARDSGRRTLVGASCGEIANAAALVIALAIDENDSRERRPRSAPPPAAEPMRRFAGAVATYGGVDFGTLPAASPGAALGVALLFPSRARLELAGSYWAPQRIAATDIHYTIGSVVAEGDEVAIRWHWSGTHRGSFRGIPPTERSLTNSGVAIFRLHGGKVVSAALETDRLGFLQSIGVVPGNDVLFEPRAMDAASPSQ
jgi:hypothetical protein